MSRSLRQSRFRIRELIGSSLPLFYLLHRLGFPWHGQVIEKSSDLVIEGFPRSGNTFAMAAFQVANGGGLRVASHTHLLGQIKLAVRWGIPTLCVVRDPQQAVASLCVRESWMRINDALRSYARFHLELWKMRDDLFWVCFSDLVSNINSVMNRFNQYYETNFRVLDNDPNSLAACFAWVDDMDRKDQGDPRVGVSTVARPHPARDEMKAAALAEIRAEPYAAELERAERVYRQFCRDVDHA